MKCPGCAQVIYNKDLAANLSVCPKCAHHFRLSATERLAMLFDAEYTVYDADLASTDPLEFTDTKPYKDRLKASIAVDRHEGRASSSATGRIDGIETVVAAMEYGFIGGSMGVVVGEKITRGHRARHRPRAAVVIVSCSGGARMMEGALSLMQMAKISAALARLDRARPAVHLGADRSDDRRRDRELRDARRPQHRRAEGAHRLRRAARHRADDPAEAARGVPAQRVPARARHARHGRRSPRAEGHDRAGPALHGRRSHRRPPPAAPASGWRQA